MSKRKKKGPDALTKWILDRFPMTLYKIQMKTYELKVKYEKLRPLFENAGGTEAIGKIGKAYEIAMKMQAIEAQLREIWTPLRDVVGPCPKCDGTREPGVMPKGEGFGCITCHDFQVIVPNKKRKKTA